MKYNPATITFPCKSAKSVSTSYKSFDILFKILPIGTLSKNKLIGAKMSDFII